MPLRNAGLACLEMCAIVLGWNDSQTYMNFSQQITCCCLGMNVFTVTPIDHVFVHVFLMSKSMQKINLLKKENKILFTLVKSKKTCCDICVYVVREFSLRPKVWTLRSSNTKMATHSCKSDSLCCCYSISPPMTSDTCVLICHITWGNLVQPGEVWKDMAKVNTS